MSLVEAEALWAFGVGSEPHCDGSRRTGRRISAGKRGNRGVLKIWMHLHRLGNHGWDGIYGIGSDCGEKRKGGGKGKIEMV